MTNARVAELLARRAEEAQPPLRKALSRASRRALSWGAEASLMWSRGEALEQLPGVGPRIAGILREWFEDPPERDEPDPLRANFLTYTESRWLLGQAGPDWRARGDLQMHTVWSDGSHEIEDMADAARAVGHEYIAITDHTKGLKIANGLDEERLARQGEEIDFLNRRLEGFRILKSAEVNLSPNGEVDMSVESLASLDLVLGCFHSKLRLKDDQTERYLAALRNPSIHILGHPRGRVYNFRLGLTADWERVFAEAAALNKAVEIDCFPDRQDLDTATLELARQAGVRISIGTDAHASHQFGFIQYGLAAAFKAGIRAERILNFLPVEELLTWARR